jgi:NAD(P)-dependent dehydrogenase (short-subunit alcohol dehydrogenase family)
LNLALAGKVALVAGATRGAGRGIALCLAEAGATVWCTGRSTRGDADRGAGKGAPLALERRPETIEETAELALARGGQAIAVRVDHTEVAQVEALAQRIQREHGRLDVLVNDIWGGDSLSEWGTPYWELSADTGFAMVQRVLYSHFLTTRHVLPLMLPQESGLVVEVTDGDFQGYRGNVFYDLAKVIPLRLALGLHGDLVVQRRKGITSLAVTPGFLRSEAVLELLGVSESNWRDGVAKDPHFAQSETPSFVGRAVAALAADPAVAAKGGRVLASWTLAEEYGFSDVDGRRPHWGRYLDGVVAAIVERGGPADEDERGLLNARYFQLALEAEQPAWMPALAAQLGVVHGASVVTSSRS